MVVIHLVVRGLGWLAFFLFAMPPVNAQPAPAPPLGIDLVVLIDHSGSMWGLKAIVGDRKSDPYSHRITGVQHLFKRLLDDVEGTPRVHQVSIIEFGDQAATIFSALEIKFSKTPNWRLLYEASFSKVQTQNLRNTNTAAAFELAAIEITKMVAKYPAKDRRRLICLITDGRPAMPNVTRESLKNRITHSFGKIRLQGGELWVLAIDAQLGYWDGKEEVFWKGLTDRERAVKADPAMPNLPNLFNNFADDWLVSKTRTVSKRNFFCPPYLRELKIAITVDQEATGVEVFTPDGRRLPKVRKSSRDKNIYYQILDPLPGEYKVETEPGRLIATRVEMVPHTLTRIAPEGPVDPGERVTLRFELRDDKGNPLAKNPTYPIRAAFAMTDPSGTVVEYPDTLEHPTTTVFAAQWTPDQMGVWQVKPKGLVTLTNGDTIDIFESMPLDNSNRLEVTDRRPLKLRLKTPNAKGGFRVFPGSATAKIQLELLDENEDSMSLPFDAVNDPQTWLGVQMVDAKGVPLTETVPLHLTPDGLFESEIPLHVLWKKGKGTLFPGEASFVIQPAPDRIGENHYLHSLWLPESLRGNRIAGNPLSMRSIPVRMPVWLWLLVWLFFALLILLLVQRIVGRIIPNWSTARRDARGQRRPVLIIYDELADPAAINAIRFPVVGKAYHNFDSKISVDFDGTEKRADKFRVKRVLAGKQETAIIDYLWEGEARTRKQPRSARVKLGQPTRLDGIPGKNYAVTLKDQNG